MEETQPRSGHPVRPWFFVDKDGPCGDRRWLSLFAGILMEAAAGSAYAFGLYANDLKADLNLTQYQIQSIGAIGNIGFYGQILTGGPLFDTFGPWIAGAYGAAGTFIGYYLMFSGAEESPNVSHGWVEMAIYASVWQNASASCDTVAISTQVMTFPGNRGLVLGMVKAFFGLSAIMIALLHSEYYTENAAGLLLFLAVATPTVTILTTACQSQVVGQAAAVARTSAAERGIQERDLQKIVAEKVQEETVLLSIGSGGRQRMCVWFVLIGLVATLITIAAFVQHFEWISVQNQWILPWLLIPLLLVIVVPVCPFPCFSSGRAYPVVPVHRVGASAPPGFEPAAHQRDHARHLGTEPEAARLQQKNRCAVEQHLPQCEPEQEVAQLSAFEHPVEAAPDFTVCGSLTTIEFWILFLIMFIGTGSGLVVFNSIGQMTLAISRTANREAIYVSLLGVGNSCGGMLFGFLSDRTKAFMPRPIWIAACVLLMGISCVLCAVSDMSLLLLAVALVGLAYGGFWTLSPSIIADIFGGRNFGMINSISSLATAGGSYAFSVGLASSLYQREIKPGEGTSCYGHVCFRMTLFVLAGLCFVAMGVGLGLAYVAWGVRGSYPKVGAICGVLPADGRRENCLDPGTMSHGSKHATVADMKREQN